jgi:curli biogenesis system outer membrane secretion channel CsgG
MRNRLSLFVIAALGAVLLIPGAALAKKKLRYSIVVSKFENRSNWHGQWDLGDAWGAVLTDSLQQTGRFIVLGENDMRKEAMAEQDFAMSGRAAGGGRKVVTGQMTPAQLLVKGEIVHFSEETSDTGLGIGFKHFRIGGKIGKAEIQVVMYIIDSSTGQVVASKRVTGAVSKKGLSLGYTNSDFHTNLGGFRKTSAGQAMSKAVDEGVKFLVEKIEDIPWTGTVILSRGNKVYINRGEREGVARGDRFVVGESEVLRDPDTGEVLDESVEKVGVIEVVKTKKKIAICKVVEGSGIAKGMTIRPVEDAS